MRRFWLGAAAGFVAGQGVALVVGYWSGRERLRVLWRAREDGG